MSKSKSKKKSAIPAVCSDLPFVVTSADGDCQADVLLKVIWDHKQQLAASIVVQHVESVTFMGVGSLLLSPQNYTTSNVLRVYLQDLINSSCYLKAAVEQKVWQLHH